MHLLVGLGNPGLDYQLTRHNMGFMVLDSFASKNNLRWQRKYRGLYSSLKFNDIFVELIKPLTYMNLSSLAITSYVAKNELNLQDLSSKLLVIHDDIDLPEGKLRFKSNSSSGGHKGVESIVELFGHSRFNRLKIGVGRPNKESEVEDFVLQKFSSKDLKLLKETIDNAVSAVEFYLTEGIVAAMSKFN